MRLQFDFDSVVEMKTEFRVAIGRGKEPALRFVRIDQSVRDVLNSAAKSTWQSMQDFDPDAGYSEEYDPSNVYGPTGYIFVPMDGQFSAKSKYLHVVDNLQELPDTLKELPRIDLYIARMVDREGRNLSAVRRVSDFGRTLKSPRLMRWFGAGLEIDNEPKFELAKDMDFLIEDSGIHVYRTKAFEGACNLDSAIKDAIAENVEYIGKQITFVDFSPFLEDSAKSIRIARALATIKGNARYQRADQSQLCHYCERLDIKVKVENGKIQVEQESQLRFLYLLTRQLLGIELVEGQPETYFAGNRRPYAD